ncbi:hypothetical protein DCAR_0832013 [Daucus carota subsp. sativus]|uniref:Uncharacterized protein n=1 Tax=Daucus carota subsp. sativus TaxID=79200 RepID=A0A175YMX2_DAUCS|nr:hypothetical protein DCAR_0832013 [Daucus carota subsp. sativus]
MVPPVAPKVLANLDGNSPGGSNSLAVVNEGKMKCKGKMFQGYAFNDNGFISSKAVGILNSGCLSSFAPTFANEVVNLEAPVGKGLFAKDVLHHVCLDSLNVISAILNPPVSPPPLPEAAGILMPVDQMLICMGFDSSSPLHAPKKARRAASV